ncbi:DUF3618 domain-containing protein [Pseudonocardia sp. KRD291]|uniref:DUF3618 domain-containing protein n=1 Tax=Pseudonocardia sp. KRD291 TaxID=2792007 RepID=UPI001C4A445C|nr:DUF3618 domain-containing protein [Pseudonocardia sp. KRD291]MBW0106996.1 DUF3618 domain-containing protein [Pseudonocardia sp. KRD291]
MTTPDNPRDPQPGPDSDAERVVADIEATRADLGETVDALAGKLDVRAQARSQVEDTRERMRVETARLRAAATDGRGNPSGATKGFAGVVVAALVGAVAVALVRRRRQR